MTSKPQNTEAAMSDTATATVGSTREETSPSSDWNPAGSPKTLQATAGRTPPLRSRPSSSTLKDSKPSKKKKPASKSAKRGSVPTKARDSKTGATKASGSRSVDTKKDKLLLSLPETASAEPWKVEQATHTMSPGGTSESLVTISKDTGSTDEPLSPVFKKRGLLSSSSKRPNAPEQATNSASKSKQSTAPPSPKQTLSSSSAAQNKQDTRRSGPSSAEFSRSTTKSRKTTSKTPAGTSSGKSSVPAATGTPKQKPRKGSDVDCSCLLDVLVANVRDITGSLSKEAGGAASSVEDSAVARLPLSSCPISAPPPEPSAPPALPLTPVPPAATRDVLAGVLPAARTAAHEKGCNLFEFTATAGTSSLILVVLLYLLRGFRSHVLDCGDYHNCSAANATYPPHT
ncbi:hypothetical protein V5799_011316 [Amblyomma americanum]|uniref:Uncharacterized protein n=1 Tax=Amblyomma americanum TaxID=6943 RepID=A0AAQ4EHC9_AMBAM